MNSDYKIENDFDEWKYNPIYTEDDYKFISDVVIPKLEKDNKDFGNVKINGKPILIFAISIKSHDLSLLLIRNGANINVIDEHGISPLIYASYHNMIEIVEILINYGANVGHIDFNNKDALTVSILRKNGEISKFLIDCGACVNRSNRYDTTPLILASSLGLYETTLRLIGAGADLDGLDKYGRTALFSAILSLAVNNPFNYGPDFDYSSLSLGYICTTEIALKLIEAGSDINAETDFGSSIIDVAIFSNCCEIVSKLIECNVDISGDRCDVLHKLVHYSSRFIDKNSEYNNSEMWASYKILKELINNGANVNARIASGTTPLMAACVIGNQCMAVELLASGADPNIQDNCGVTPLMIVSCGGNIDMVCELLKYGANVNIFDKYGNSPLIRACILEHYSTICMLVAHGSDIYHYNENFYSPMIWAKEHGLEDLFLRLSNPGKNNFNLNFELIWKSAGNIVANFFNEPVTSSINLFKIFGKLLYYL